MHGNADKRQTDTALLDDTDEVGRDAKLPFSLSLSLSFSFCFLSVFSVAHERVSHAHAHEHEHDHHTATRINSIRQWVGSLPQGHPGHLWHPIGSRQDTHCTLVPKRDGRGWPEQPFHVRQDFRRQRKIGTNQKQALSRLSLRNKNRSHCHLEIIHFLFFSVFFSLFLFFSFFSVCLFFFLSFCLFFISVLSLFISSCFFLSLSHSFSLSFSCHCGSSHLIQGDENFGVTPQWWLIRWERPLY